MLCLCPIAVVYLFLHTCGVQNANSVTFLCLCLFLLFLNPSLFSTTYWYKCSRLAYEDVTARVIAARPWLPAGALSSNVLTIDYILRRFVIERTDNWLYIKALCHRTYWQLTIYYGALSSNVLTIDYILRRFVIERTDNWLYIKALCHRTYWQLTIY